MDMKNINLLGIIALVGAIILVVGVFLGWLTPSGATDPKTYTGWDIQNNVDNIKSGFTLFGVTVPGLGYAFVPLVALICGIISLILMIVPTVMNTEKFEMINNILGIVALIAAAVVVICGLLFYMQSMTTTVGMVEVTKKITEYYTFGIGFWLVLVGGIITLVGGLMPILKNKFL